MKHKILTSPIWIIFVAAFLRILPHEPNVAPIGAMALFGGVYLSKKQAVVVPILAMLVSDYFLGFHSVMGWVYGSFLLTVVIGFFIKKQVSFKSVLVASTSASILFFLITNFGVWYSGLMYPKTLAGLIDCYYMGLPFFRNTLLGDYGFNLIFFGGYVVLHNLGKRYAKNFAGDGSSGR